VPNGFQFNQEGKLISYQFAMMVMDRQFESSSNTIEVLSDTAGVLIDIVTLLIRNNRLDEEFEILVNATAEPFYDSSTDIVAGHAIDFVVNTPYLESRCDIPT
jgi:hypothetical protein